MNKLTSGLENLCRLRKVEILHGEGKFLNDKSIVVEDAEDGKQTVIEFENCIIAAGSRPVKILGFPYDDPRIWDSGSLENKLRTSLKMPV